MKTLDEFIDRESKEKMEKEIQSLETRIKRGRIIMRINKKILLPLTIGLGLVMIILMLLGIKNMILISSFFILFGFIRITALLIDIPSLEQKLADAKELLALTK